ncbi:DUF2474 domain-containing protein [Methylotenera versatilis]|uniref:DUF2474 family protein n=1 Tax=Methylotenera versatilis TaxID=1055487 RepID=UPI0009DF630F
MPRAPNKMGKDKVWLKRLTWLVVLWFSSVLLVVILSWAIKFLMAVVGYKS